MNISLYFKNYVKAQCGFAWEIGTLCRAWNKLQYSDDVCIIHILTMNLYTKLGCFQKLEYVKLFSAKLKVQLKWGIMIWIPQHDDIEEQYSDMSFFPLSSGIASCVGIAGTVMWFLHLTRPCCIALGQVLICELWVIDTIFLW